MRFVLLFVMLFTSTAGCVSRQQSDANNNFPARSQDAQVTRAATGPITYVALGDSTGVGVGGTGGGYVPLVFGKLQGSLPGSQLRNYSVSGATSSDVLARQLEKAIAAKPQLVTISVGVNDIRRSVSLDRFGANYDEMLRRLETETDAVVVVSNLPDLSSSRHVPQPIRPQMRAAIEQYNGRLRAVAQTRGSLLFDIYSLTHENLGEESEYFARDGFHPSDAGYEMWAEKLWPTVAVGLGLTE